jgi:hypothetical protein
MTNNNENNKLFKKIYELIKNIRAIKAIIINETDLNFKAIDGKAYRYTYPET